MDRGAWWAIVHGVMESQTRLKRLSLHAVPLQSPLLTCTLSKPIPSPAAPEVPTSGSAGRVPLQVVPLLWYQPLLRCTSCSNSVCRNVYLSEFMGLP